MNGVRREQPTETAQLPRVTAILVAAGRGRRFGAADNKVLRPLAGQPIWLRSAMVLRNHPRIGEIVMVVHPADRANLEEPAQRFGIRLVDGGRERVDSVRAGLDEVERVARATDRLAERRVDRGEPVTARWVAVHDAARPLVPVADIDQVIATALDTGAAILATPLRGTIKLRGLADDVSTVDRRRLWEALTPQVFREDILRSAYERWRGRPVTDDAELVERSGVKVSLVPGSAENLKITHAEDLILAEAILARRQAEQLPIPVE